MSTDQVPFTPAFSLSDREFVRGVGCPHCNSTGYSGRIGVYQLLELDSEMSDALGQGDRSRFVDAARSAAGYQSLDEAALVYAGKGITSLNEAMRLAADLGGDDVPDMDWQTASAAA